MADDYSINAVITADSSGFARGVRNAQNSIKSLGKVITTVTKTITGLFAIKGLADFGKTVVKQADEANKIFKILSNTVEATGASVWTTTQELDKMAKAYAKTTDYTVSEIEQMQSVLLGFRDITGETFGEATDAIMDMATVMGMSLTGATQAVGKALDDPIKGIDSLRRQGFAFTEEQKAELTQLVKNGEKLKAQKIILDELSTTYGGAAKAGQSSFSKLSHIYDEFKENLGNKLLPIVNKVMGAMGTVLEDMTRKLEDIDFQKIFAIIENVFTKIQTVLIKTRDLVITVFTEIKDYINGVNFSPFITIIDTVAGVVKKAFVEIKTSIQNSMSSFGELKDRMGGFSDLLNVDKIVDIVNTIVDVFFFLRDTFTSIGDEIKDIVFGVVETVWGYIKQIFDNSNSALEQSGTSIQSWGDLFYEILNNNFKIFQDFFGSIKAILRGDWELAWEYAKLAVLRMADNILKALSSIMNAFPKLVNKVIDGVNVLLEGINKVREFFGDDPIGLVKAFESVDLSESSGVGKQILNAERNIMNLLGESADKGIKEIEKVSLSAKGFTQRIIGGIKELTNVEVENADERATYEKKTYAGVTSDAKNTYKTITDWDIKLLQQKQENLKEYSREYHKIQLGLIEAERQKALDDEEIESERAKINKYYDKQIELEYKRHTKALVENLKTALGKITDIVKKVGSVVINAFKKMFDLNLDDALDNLLVFEDKILTFFVETLPRLPQFFASAMQSVTVLLESVLNVITPEKIAGTITGIVDILKNNIPKIIGTIGEIISGLVDGIVNSFPDILDALNIIVEKLAEVLPQMIQKVIELFIGILQNPEKIAKLVVSIIKGIVEIFNVLIKNIGPLIEALVPAIGTIIIELIKAIPDILTSMSKALSEAIGSIAKAIVNLLIDALNLLLDGISKLWTWTGMKALPHIPKLATGTDNAKRGIALVGEAGPELVRFNGGEQVLNNRNTQKALAGVGNSGNTFNVTFNNTMDTTAYAMMSQLKQYNRQMAINGVI